MERSTIGDGCAIKGSRLKNVMVGLRSTVCDGCDLEDTLVMGADYYESPEAAVGETPVGIGAGTKIRKAIIDKNARIGKNCQILNEEGVMDKDCESEGYIIRDGIIVVIKDAVIPDGTVI